MSAGSSSLTPSTQRAIPMRMRNDLRIRRIEYQGGDYWVVKDPVALTYHRLQPEQQRQPAGGLQRAEDGRATHAATITAGRAVTGYDAGASIAVRPVRIRRPIQQGEIQ